MTPRRHVRLSRLVLSSRDRDKCIMNEGDLLFASFSRRSRILRRDGLATSSIGFCSTRIVYNDHVFHE